MTKKTLQDIRRHLLGVVKAFEKELETCQHSFVDKDNNGIYDIEVCRYCGIERQK